MFTIITIKNQNILTSQLKASKNIPSPISGLIPTIGTGPLFYYRKGGFCHYDRRRKEAPAGPASAGGGSGPKPGQGAKGKNTQTDSDRCNSGKGAAGSAEHGAAIDGGISITKNEEKRLNCSKVSGKMEAFSFSRRAHLLTTSSSQSPLTSVSAFGENCGRSLAPPLPTKQALRGPLSAVVFPAETVRSARRMRLLRAASRQCHSACECRCHRLRSRPYRTESAIWPAACENLPPAALSQRWTALPPCPFSLLRKRNRKIGGEATWRFITWKQR